jgi:hypothetical protein
MNKEEARAIAEQQLVPFRAKSYVQLTSLLVAPVYLTSTASSGQTYNVKIEAVWDDQQDGDLRVWALIDDGSLIAAVLPQRVDFIMRRDGSFVGE